jgi:multiple sugar transport system substrate-binding protein
LEALDRRTFLKRAGIAGAGLLALPGCGGGGGGGDDSGPVTLRWSMWSDTPEERKIWQGLADKVHQKYPDITVKLETTTFQNYWDKLQTQIASQTQADVVGMQAQRMPGFAARGALQSMQSRLDSPDLDFKDFFPVIEDALSFKDEVHALAYDLGPPLLYYNKALFQKAGAEFPSADTPMSWDEFHATAKKLTDPGARTYGYIQGFAIDSVIPWIWGNGGDYMNEDATECTLDQPEAMEAMQFLSDLFNKDKVAAPVTDLANPNFGLERFFSGKVGMHMDGPWQIVNIRSNAKFDFDIAPIPAGSAGSKCWAAGSGFGISKATKHADSAFKAISVITGKEALASLTKAGRGYPARQSAVPIFEAKSPPKHAAIVQRVLNSKIGETRPFRATATWQETDVMLTQELMPAIFLGNPGLQDAVAKVKPKFDALLKRAQDIENR